LFFFLFIMFFLLLNFNGFSYFTFYPPPPPPPKCCIFQYLTFCQWQSLFFFIYTCFLCKENQLSIPDCYCIAQQVLLTSIFPQLFCYFKNILSNSSMISDLFCIKNCFSLPLSLKGRKYTPLVPMYSTHVNTSSQKNIHSYAADCSFIWLHRMDRKM
jgi:hypothetical protein